MPIFHHEVPHFHAQIYLASNNNLFQLLSQLLPQVFDRVCQFGTTIDLQVEGIVHALGAIALPGGQNALYEKWQVLSVHVRETQHVLCMLFTSSHYISCR